MFRFTTGILLAAIFANADAQDFGKKISTRDYKMAASKLYTQMKKTFEDDGRLIIDLDQVAADTLVKQVFEEYGLTIPIDETLTFKVSGNPTTGYEWHYNDDVVNDAFVVTEEYVMDTVEDWQEGYTGIGGTYYFTLSASEGAI